MIIITRLACSTKHDYNVDEICLDSALPLERLLLFYQTTFLCFIFTLRLFGLYDNESKPLPRFVAQPARNNL